MPAPVATFFPIAATLTKSTNVPLKPPGGSSPDALSFPNALEKAEHVEAQKPREHEASGSNRVAPRPTRKSGKAHGQKKNAARSTETEGTDESHDKEAKTATAAIDGEVSDQAAVHEDDPDPAADANLKGPSSETAAAQTVAAQSALQQVGTPKSTSSPVDEEAKRKGGDPAADPLTNVIASHTDGDAETRDSAEDDDAAPQQPSEQPPARAVAAHNGSKTSGAKPGARAEAEIDPGLAAASSTEARPVARPSPAADKLDSSVDAFSALSDAADSVEPAARAGDAPAASDGTDAAAFNAVLASAHSASSEHLASKLDPVPTTPPTQHVPEVRFAEQNHDRIVSSVKTDLLPGGGTMQIRLDPPELGPMAVSVHMRDGVMTATFETSNDEASRLLSHSLGELKSTLEAQGISVEKLHVQQTPKSAQSRSGDDPQQHREGKGTQQEASARQDQQRKELLRKMWRKLSGFQDPLDVTG